ncbi:hypothetical protein M0R45_011491 [Rubus argutus]|uniref:Uncharacterized protein n=1 Tax=Rubus argutus TaxID=59490 RepID=A0AAW1YDS7_RUBAR
MSSNDSEAWNVQLFRSIDNGAALGFPETPFEATQRGLIISKIEAGERFAVYIVIPMWPEGVPESGSVQAILDWQRRTMEMMYTDISEALHRKGLNENPRDYLTFFCLGTGRL